MVYKRSRRLQSLLVQLKTSCETSFLGSLNMVTYIMWIWEFILQSDWCSLILYWHHLLYSRLHWFTTYESDYLSCLSMPFFLVQTQQINCGFPLFCLLVARLLQSAVTSNVVQSTRPFSHVGESGYNVSVFCSNCDSAMFHNRVHHTRAIGLLVCAYAHNS